MSNWQFWEPSLDYHWVTDRLAVGGAIYTRRNMEALAAAGITHVLDMQDDFDDSQIADGAGLRVLWNPFNDDLLEKPPEVFRRAVEFAAEAYQDPRSRIYFHCAMGVHRGPLMLLAFLAVQGMGLDEATELILRHHPHAEFPEVYRRSVERFLESYRTG